MPKFNNARPNQQFFHEQIFFRYFDEQAMGLDIVLDRITDFSVKYEFQHPPSKKKRTDRQWKQKSPQCCLHKLNCCWKN